MDGSIFKEILRGLREEAIDDPDTWSSVADQIADNMRTRAAGFAAQEFPYGSEFAFDTTGQEEVVTWLLFFAHEQPSYVAAANRTVSHILSYMRNSPTWAYHGGSRSWGDLGNSTYIESTSSVFYTSDTHR